jgi:hypothetical protein
MRRATFRSLSPAWGGVCQPLTRLTAPATLSHVDGEMPMITLAADARTA